MKETGIMFSAPMVRATIEDIKQVTRRLRGLDLINEKPDNWQFEWAEPRNNNWCFTDKTTLTPQTLKERTFEQASIKCPFGVPGDRLWVRETFSRFGSEIFYRADYEPGKDKMKWKPAIHMPRVACRILLELVEVRVERLHNISEEDAENEGVYCYGSPRPGEKVFKDYLMKDREDIGVLSAVLSFQTLWASLHGIESWLFNPWVWVLKFKRIDAEKPCLKCGGKCNQSKALYNPACGVPDANGSMEGATLSPSNHAQLVEVLKCEKCGHSFTPGTNS